MQNARNPKTQSLKIEGIKDIIAIASGKGGVGKSATAGTNFSLLSSVSKM